MIKDLMPGQNPARIGNLVFGPDGSRRWANDHNSSFADAYKLAVRNTVEGVIDWCLDEKGMVDSLSIWAMQEYNFDRPGMQALIAKAFVASVEMVCGSKAVTMLDLQVEVVGELDVLFKNYDGKREDFYSPLKRTEDHKGKKIYILGPYNGSKELIRAIHKCDEKRILPTFDNLADNWRIPRIDFFLRTGQPKGFNRLSDYFPGSEKARLASTPTFAQDLTKEEFDSIIHSFLNIEDSYEKLKRR
jgi:undecaprenyl diphosphate synthase